MLTSILFPVDMTMAKQFQRWILVDAKLLRYNSVSIAVHSRPHDSTGRLILCMTRGEQV
jgi:hypothetical protein